MGLLKAVILVLFLSGISLYAYSQPNSVGTRGNGNGNGPCDTPPCNVPIDGGLTLLAAAGSLLGIRFLKQKKSQ